MAGAATLLGAAAARAEPDEEPPARPIAFQDAGAFAQPFLQLPFEAPEPVARGELEVSARTLYSNSIARERNRALSVDVSLESAAPSLFLRYGLGRGLELELSVPGAYDYAGFLPRPIKFVERLFDALNPLREGRPPATAYFRILRSDGAGLDWSGSGGRADDPWIGLKQLVRAQREWAPAMSWRIALQVPTAPLPWGSGLYELGTGLVERWTMGATSVLLETDVMIPQGGPITAAALRTRPHFAVQVGVVRRFGRRVTGMLQGSAHTSPITGTGLEVVDGSTLYLLAGIGVEPTRTTSASFALVENMLHPNRGADITAVLELAWRFGPW